MCNAYTYIYIYTNHEYTHTHTHAHLLIVLFLYLNPNQYKVDLGGGLTCGKSLLLGQNWVKFIWKKKH